MKSVERYALPGLAVLLGVRAFVALLSANGLNWDFVNFYNAGSRAFHGELENLYKASAPIAGREPFGAWSAEYVGFPISAALFAPLGAFEARVALGVFKLACAAVAGAALFLLQRYLASTDPWWSSRKGLSLSLAAALLLEPMWFVFEIGGQGTPFGFLFAVLFLRAYSSGRIGRAAAFLSLAVLLKPVLAPSIGVLLIGREWRLLAGLAAAFSLEALLSLALFGWQVHAEWVALVAQEAARWAVPLKNNASLLAIPSYFWIYLHGAKIGLSPMPQALELIQIVWRISLVGLFAWLATIVRRRRSDIRREREDYALLGLSLAMFFPAVIWPHYLVFMLVPIALLALRWNELSRAGRLLLAAVCLSLLRANHPVMTVILANVHVNTIPETVAAGLYGSSTLLLSLILVLGYFSGRLNAPAGSFSREG